MPTEYINGSKAGEVSVDAQRINELETEVSGKDGLRDRLTRVEVLMAQKFQHVEEKLDAHEKADAERHSSTVKLLEKLDEHMASNDKRVWWLVGVLLMALLSAVGLGNVVAQLIK